MLNCSLTQSRYLSTSALVKKLVKVALVGSPNAGKSTLFNRLVGSDISCVSNKVHTTRKNVVGMYTQDDTQIVLYDSPGVITTNHLVKHRLESSLHYDPSEATEKCDLIAVVVDATNIREQKRLNKGAIELLNMHQTDKKSVLVMNKADKLKEKRLLLDIGTTLSSPEVGYKHFSRFFSVSALTDDGVGELRNYLLSQGKPVEKWPHGPNTVSKERSKDIVHALIRGHVMDHTDQQVPYMLKFIYRLVEFDELDNLHVYLILRCPQDYMVPRVLGEQGLNLRKIRDKSRESISRTLACDTKLIIQVDSERNKLHGVV